MLVSQSAYDHLFSVVSISSYAEVQNSVPAVSHGSMVTFVEKPCAKALTHAKASHFPPQHLSASTVDWGAKGKPLPTSTNSKVREKKHLGCIWKFLSNYWESTAYSVGQLIIALFLPTPLLCALCPMQRLAPCHHTSPTKFAHLNTFSALIL